MKKEVLTLCLLLALVLPSVAQSRSLLTDKYASLKAENPFRTGGEWFPYPEYSDREGWTALMGDAAGIFVEAGERFAGFRWRTVPATSYLEYERTGVRTVMEVPMNENRMALNALMLAELAEGKGRFIDDILNGVWQLSQMPSWVLSAHQPRQASKRSLPDTRFNFIDLYSGAVGVQLSVAWHFFHEAFDRIDPSISYTIRDAVSRKILRPYLDPDKFESQWWLGFRLKPGMVVNNWNPWCNSDSILCFLLVEEDQELLDAAIAQSVRSVDMFLNYVKSDGACEEGPAYWGHAAGKLFDYLQILYDASDAAFDVFDDPQIRAMGEYVSRSYVGGDWVVNFADASARLSLPPSVIYSFGKGVHSRELMDFALSLLADGNGFAKPSSVIFDGLYKSLEQNKGNITTIGTVVDFLEDIYLMLDGVRILPQMTSEVDSLNRLVGKHGSRDEAEQAMEACRMSLRKSVPGFVWYPETQFCYVRDKGWFFAAKGGHNNESHNHNDVGTFILYIDNVPVFADAGVGTYTKQTFSSERYSIWSMQSDWHNLPVINGSSQKFGGEYRAEDIKVSESGRKQSFSLNIAPAYPSASRCDRWTRSFVLSPGRLVLTDSFSLSERLAADVEHFLVQGEVFMPGELYGGRRLKAGELVIENSGVAVSLTYPSTLHPSVEEKPLADPRLTNVWGASLRRISLTSSPSAPLSGKYVFSVSRCR